MTVRDLINALETCDENAQVYLLGRKGTPYEYEIHGIARRRDVDRAETDRDNETKSSGNPRDVLIIEGECLGYGSETAWEVSSEYY